MVCSIRNEVQPEYPVYARRNNIRGTVTVEALVDEAGKLEDIKVLSSPHSSLTNAVIRAVRQWQFPISTKEGKAEKYSPVLSFTFQ